MCWCQGKVPLSSVGLMTSPDSRETTEQNAFCTAPKFKKLIEL